MTQTQQAPATVTNLKVAKEVEAIKMDPGLGAYSFDNLGSVVQFADLMSAAGEMLPAHIRGRPALCLAVTMRAIQWKFDPFALAQETYQAKDGGVIGYQAKVFVAALRNCAGIQLQYEYSGEVKWLDKPATSANGKEVAKRQAVGDRKVRAWAEIDGMVLEYETPTLDQITVKNSPQWHNDPNQQLAYYAGRGWARRHRPEVMMGAYSEDEVISMPSMRDVTPKPSGFANLALQARQDAQATNPTAEGETTSQAAAQDAHDPETADSTPVDGEIMADEVEIDPKGIHYRNGADAAKLGFSRAECPKDLDPAGVANWFAGFDSIQEA